MSNMSYCRFQNTLEDLKDCRDALYDGGLGDLSKDDGLAARRMFTVCREILELQGYEVRTPHELSQSA